MESKRNLYRGMVIGAVVTAIASIGFYQSQTLTASETPQKRATQSFVDMTVATPSNVSDLNKIYETAANTAMQSVVTVLATKNTNERRGLNPFEFFRERRNQPDTYKQEGSGSGVILSSDGYIVTNNHVVGEADEIDVQLLDRRQYRAKVIGTDPLTDIALIKIDAKDLNPIKFGSSENARIGQQVMAIGNPLSIGTTVTMGIISALGRNNGILNRTGYEIEAFIQTDAAINPGNSGGALINLNGDLIGVNTAIATRTGYYSGYGFAVPSDIVKFVVDEIKKNGKVRRGYIGINLRTVDYKIAKANGWKYPKGVYVVRVISGKPGEKAGLKADDIILEVDGVEVNASNELQVEVSKKPYNAEVRLKVFRDGKILTKKLRLEERETDQTLVSNTVSKTLRSRVGFDVEMADDRTLDRYDLQFGVQVTNVVPGSDAYNEGLRSGDVIIKAGDVDLKDRFDLEDYIDSKKAGDIIKLYVQPRRFREQQAYKRFIHIELD